MILGLEIALRRRAGPCANRNRLWGAKSSPGVMHACQHSNKQPGSVFFPNESTFVPASGGSGAIQNFEYKEETQMKLLRKTRYTTAIRFASVLLLATMPWVTLATGGAHFFHDTTDSIADNSALSIHIDEAGVGQQQVNYTLDVVTASATYACINGGGKHPSAANKQTFSSSVASGFAETPQNGRVDVTTTINGTPLSADGFSCPSGQTMVLASVSYSGITLTDTTNGVSTTLPDVSRTFFNI